MKIYFILLALIAPLLFETGCSDNKTVTHLNKYPKMTSADEAQIAGTIDFVYKVEFTEADGPDTTITFHDYPGWLTADTDSIFGTPPDSVSDTFFTVIISDGLAADTSQIDLKVIASIIIYGDSRSGHDTHQQIVNLIMGHDPEIVFHTGDMVNNGLLESDWTTFFDIAGDMINSTEFYPALGNHERQSAFYFDYFDLPGNEEWYTIDRYGCRFIILNSYNEVDSGSEQYSWMVNELATIDDSINYTLVLFHHPPLSTGRHDDDYDLQAKWVPIFEQYGVDAVFGGHNHCYEKLRCNDIDYVVSGGGGAPLYAQARELACSQLYLTEYHYCKLFIFDEKIIVKVINIDSQIIDRFEIMK